MSVDAEDVPAPALLVVFAELFRKNTMFEPTASAIFPAPTLLVVLAARASVVQKPAERARRPAVSPSSSAEPSTKRIVIKTHHIQTSQNTCMLSHPGKSLSRGAWYFRFHMLLDFGRNKDWWNLEYLQSFKTLSS
jgi:hypothetical protein